MTTTVKEILEAKEAAGEDAFLWLHSSGDCILCGPCCKNQQ
ncbi:hypothetical protein [Geoalkalibacter sp.]|nr:hypothetical protein [Geoalkalibacter sp.]